VVLASEQRCVKGLGTFRDALCCRGAQGAQVHGRGAAATLRARRDGKLEQFSVADTGTGIAVE
jgi:hypothetical protein